VNNSPALQRNHSTDKKDERKGEERAESHDGARTEETENKMEVAAMFQL
jgi:hypothetical protein